MRHPTWVAKGKLTKASGGEPSAAGQPSAMDLASTAARRAAAALCADAGAAGPLAAPAVGEHQPFCRATGSEEIVRRYVYSSADTALHQATFVWQ